MLTGLLVLVIVLAAASAAGFALRGRQGRFRPVEAPAAPPARSAPPAGSAPFAGMTPFAGTGAADSGRPPFNPAGGLSAADLGAPLGPAATLVQFSTPVCAYCGPTRELLQEVAAERDGVAFVEIDAADRMDLTRRLSVMATPTVLVLDAAGGIRSRASGPVRRAELLTAVGQVTGRGGRRLEFPTKMGDNGLRVGGTNGDSGPAGE